MLQQFSIRRYVAADIPAILALGHQMVEQTRQGQDSRFKPIALNDEKLYKILSVNERNIRFFLNLVHDKDEKLVGLLCGEVQEYYFSSECLAADHMLYFDPEFCSLAAIKDLINSYVAWAKNRNVREVLLRSSTGFKQEKFGMLLKRLGFSQFEVGFSKEF
jgi:hypothetical protein